MNSNTAVVCIIALMVLTVIGPISIIVYQKEKTARVAMEHGYVQVNGQWVKENK